ncbi:M56 family metallopeptidase [Flavobacterium sp. LAR06]|uniref:M56 family metallopeptidase n=1 Tax=Flavobacterium sp. LAR06 TaxID=3064897 RepID=UPI0035C254EE
MITYLLKSGLLLVIFYAVYKLALENEKMFRFNRVYLIGSLIFSFVIPLQLFSIKPLFSTPISVVQLDGIVIQTNEKVSDQINYYQILIYTLGIIYTLVAIVLIFRFIKNLYSFYKNIKYNQIQIVNDQKIVLVKESILPHSFWNAIFINNDEFENGKIPSELIVHEQAHIKQKHSLDILFIEILQIIFWFNPLIILFKKAIKLNHEFLADQAVNEQFESVSTYQSLLLDIAYNKTNIALASNINYLITKKRFLMMTKEESPLKIILKVFTVGIVSVLMLFIFSTDAVAQEVSKIENKSKDFRMTTDVDVKPEFPGGIVEFYKFVGQNYRIPEELSKNKTNGKVYLQFMIEKDGSLSEITILRDKLGYGAGEEAVRVLKLSPKWIPASDKGKPVRVMYSLPITIQPSK